MKYIKTYNTYKMNEKILLVSGLDTTNESILFKQVFDKLLKNTKPDVRLELESYISENINEGFFDKLKSRFPSFAPMKGSPEFSN